MTQEWAGSTTSYRLYCQSCDAETVVHADAVDVTDWRVTSLHFHEGYCPACARDVDGAGEDAPAPAAEAVEVSTRNEAAADGGQPTLAAFSDDVEAGMDG